MARAIWSRPLWRPQFPANLYYRYDISLKPFSIRKFHRKGINTEDFCWEAHIINSADISTNNKNKQHTQDVLYQSHPDLSILTILGIPENQQFAILFQALVSAKKVPWELPWQPVSEKGKFKHLSNLWEILKDS